jgi:hypothetical protein
MSVIVKGMEIPKNCKECMFADMDDVDFDYVLYCTVNEKYVDLDMYDHPMGWDCPMIEIPTHHGRLIDAEKLLIDHGLKLTEEFAPTVIEAEGSET